MSGDKCPEGKCPGGICPWGKCLGNHVLRVSVGGGGGYVLIFICIYVYILIITRMTHMIYLHNIGFRERFHPLGHLCNFQKV